MSSELRRLGKYELRERLGSGGQGDVWKAFDGQLRRFVAIKRLHTAGQQDPHFAARFEREAQFIALLRHPHIVQIHDFQFEPALDSQTAVAYMVMDFVEGPTLAEYIRTTSRLQRYPSASDVVSIFTAISLALDYAHQKGMLHRDIKPANIMLDQRDRSRRPMGEPVLMDFGIARFQGGDAETTKVLGTPLYVSPEQAQGLPIDRRSDLYSLGILLYEMMTGWPPFHGKSAMAILMQHYLEEPQPPERLNPQISPELSAVIVKSIAKDPAARFASASAMTIALAEALHVPVPPELLKAPTQPSLSGPVGMTNPLSLPPEALPTVLKAPAPPSPANEPTCISSGNDRQTVITPTSKRPKRKRPVPILIIVLIVLSLGLASFTFFALNKTGETPVANTVVGQVVFSHSQGQTEDFDTVKITLKGIADDTTDGKRYEAWLETHDFNNGANIHWSFNVQHGILIPSSYQQQDLLTPLPYLLLITRQSGSSIVPSFNISDRLYYARIPQVDRHHSTFALLPCPSGETNNICLS